jgi:hypothetical protein
MPALYSAWSVKNLLKKKKKIIILMIPVGYHKENNSETSVGILKNGKSTCSEVPGNYTTRIQAGLLVLKVFQ